MDKQQRPDSIPANEEQRPSTESLIQPASRDSEKPAGSEEGEVHTGIAREEKDAVDGTP
jgi:hypothetical protein